MTDFLFFVSCASVLWMVAIAISWAFGLSRAHRPQYWKPPESSVTAFVFAAIAFLSAVATLYFLN